MPMESIRLRLLQGFVEFLAERRKLASQSREPFFEPAQKKLLAATDHVQRFQHPARDVVLQVLLNNRSAVLAGRDPMRFRLLLERGQRLPGQPKAKHPTPLAETHLKEPSGYSGSGSADEASPSHHPSQAAEQQMALVQVQAPAARSRRGSPRGHRPPSGAAQVGKGHRASTV